MIKTQTAFTAEIDDTDKAVAEILSQLDLKNGLLKNSIGLLSFYPDFCASGVLKALNDKLPFRTTGATTLGNAAPGSEGDMILTLMLLTSDDVSFDVALSGPMAPHDDSAIKAAYREAAAASPGEPKLIISYFPVCSGIGGNVLVDALTSLVPGVPVFGTLAADPNHEYQNTKVVCDGESHADRCAVIVIKGEVSPRFFLASISKEKFFKDKAVVTDSDDNILRELNYTPAVEYIAANMGLAKTFDGRLLQAEIFPLVVDFNDGSPPILRGMLAYTEERHIVLAGDVPKGVSLSVGMIDAQDVLHTTGRLLDEITSSQRPDCLLLFSCTARFLTLGLYDQAEIDAVREKLDGFSPYMMAYAGGEICPVADESGRLANRLHNYTFIACAL